MKDNDNGGGIGVKPVKGVDKLGLVLHSRMVQTSAAPAIIEFGTIKSNLSLQTDSYPVPIPKGQYHVCRSLVHKDPLTVTKDGDGNHGHGPSGGHAQYSGDGIHSHPATEGGHVHQIVRPANMRPLKAGDRVLVAWIGSEAVVVDVVLPEWEG